MALIPELMPYVAIGWRDLEEVLHEMEDREVKQLAQDLNTVLGRVDLTGDRMQLVELIWLAVGRGRSAGRSPQALRWRVPVKSRSKK